MSATKMSRMLVIGLVVVALAMFGVTGYLYYQFYGIPRCPACGMLITPEMDEHFKIYTDGWGEGERVHACCIGCVFRLLDPERGWDELYIETFCDYYGPDKPIRIHVWNHGKNCEVDPPTAKVLLGAKIVKSCAVNRIVYDDYAAEKLLKIGYTEHTMKYQHVPLPEGTPVIPPCKCAPMLAEKVGIAYVPPSPIVPVSFAIVGIVILLVSIVMYRRTAAKG
ncbi:TPA: hypothetical protein EYP27_02440 [Candidatus Bathyarchaeota archaeon]|nr:hypothetical protein [Candidatus Bathyarchaeota archaeon]